MTNRMWILIGLLLTVPLPSSVTQAGQQVTQHAAALVGARADVVDVRDFVRGIHADSVSYDAAREYNTSEDLRILLDMLGNVDDAQYWPNVTMVLGATGNPAIVGPLIEFLHGGRNDTPRSTAVHRGRRSAITGLGYFAHETHDLDAMEYAMGYLLESVYPRTWSEREIPWLGESERLHMRLSMSAILALALTGRDEAENTLRDLAAADDMPASLRQVAESVLPDWEKINAYGLEEYYRTSEQGAPLAAIPSRR